MEDRKNIVIKVKYPTTGTKGSVAHPKLVDQWDFKKIGIAAGGVLFVLLLLLFVFSGDDESTEQTITIEQPIVIEKSATIEPKVIKGSEKPVSKVSESVTKVGDTSKIVLRSMLTFNIKDSEPQAPVTSPLHVSKTKPVSVFYFSELNNLKGKTVYHEWLLEGELITRKKVNISGDNWRITSRQYLNDNIKNHWVVRVVDEKGHLITQIPFQVIYE